MGSFDALLERPRLDRGFAVGIRESGAVVGNAQPKEVLLDSEPDVDALRPAVADGIGNRLAKQLLEIELKPDRDRCLLAVCSDVAVD
jgi:hypothetical protein